MGTWLRRLWVGGAALCLLACAALLVFEESGLLARLVRSRLAQELGPLGERLTLEHAELSWFEPGLELIGLTLASPGMAATSELELGRVHVTFSPRLDGLRSLRISGGRVLLSEKLIDDWIQLTRQRSESPASTAPFVLPPAALAGLEVALELYDRSRLELGSLDLCARTGSGGQVELAGRLAPSVAGALVATDPIRLSGVLAPEGVRLWASARDLELATRALPSGALTRPLPISDGAARLTLDASFELVHALAARPKGHVRASLTQGRAAWEGRPPLTDLGLELEADLAPSPGTDLWNREAWDARGVLHGRLGEMPLELEAEFGRAVPNRAWLRAWGRAHGVPLEREAMTQLGLEESIAFVREMLDPRGRLDLEGTLSLGREGGAWTRDLAVHAHAAGTAGLTYLGFPGDPQSGLALPVSAARGELVAGESSRAERPWRMAAFGLSGDHGSGRIEGWTQVTAPSRAPGAFPQPELDLELTTRAVDVNAPLLRALSENQYLAWLEPEFSPQGGTVGGVFRVRTGPELDGTSAEGTLALHGLSLRWQDLPVQMDGVSGAIAMRWSRENSKVLGQPLLTKRSFGVDYRLDNRATEGVSGARAGVSGWVREAPLPPVFDPSLPAAELLQEVRVEIDALKLRGGDFDTLAARFPALEQQVGAHGAVGIARVTFVGAQAGLGTPFRTAIQATPVDVNATPQFFQRQTRGLRGRVLIEGEEQDDQTVNAVQFALAGKWPGGVELSAQGLVPPVGTAHVQVYGAGIDPSNTSFKGALITTLSSGKTTAEDIDLSSWTLEGPVDLVVTASFDPLSTDAPVNRYQIQLRDNDLRARDIVLRDLHGTLSQEGEVLSSPLVEATLAGHPLELRRVRTFPLAVLSRVTEADDRLLREGFWQDAKGRALQADLFTRDLPLDADHLTGLLEPAGLEALRNNRAWRGAIDVLDANLLVTIESENRSKVALRGRLRPHDLRMRLGLPIEVDTANVQLEELVQESGRARGWARVSGVAARIAERELSDASLIAGYVDGRLTIDNLSGAFEGGRLESLGGAGGGASKALGIDLAEPNRFDLAMRLSQVNVGSLLRGVFQSSIADEGVLDASLQLSGTPGEILALTGRGTLALDEGALWSIPVIRALFAQLGFDKSGLFDRLRSRFELRGGRLQVSHLEVRSSLLDLVGEGWQDLNGELAYDLEVRYSLLDKLGFVGRMLYWLNNNLMRVAVRGDFERPVITVRNAFVELLSSFEDAPSRSLPLPGFSALGARF